MRCFGGARCHVVSHACRERVTPVHVIDCDLSSGCQFYRQNPALLSRLMFFLLELTQGCVISTFKGAVAHVGDRWFKSARLHQISNPLNRRQTVGRPRG
jgi:hypothetical protein